VSGLQEEKDQGIYSSGFEGSVADKKCSVIKSVPHVRIAQEQGSNVPVPRQDLFSFMQIRRQDSPKPSDCFMNETTQ
jgi:hypothetical protein